jgi:hypothetical protein
MFRALYNGARSAYPIAPLQIVNMTVHLPRASPPHPGFGIRLDFALLSTRAFHHNP